MRCTGTCASVCAADDFSPPPTPLLSLGNPCEESRTYRLHVATALPQFFALESPWARSKGPHFLALFFLPSQGNPGAPTGCTWPPPAASLWILRTHFEGPIFSPPFSSAGEPVRGVAHLPAARGDRPPPAALVGLWDHHQAGPRQGVHVARQRRVGARQAALRGGPT